MLVLGIDPSLTSTGYAIGDGRMVTTGTIKPKKLTGPERLLFIQAAIENMLDERDISLVAYEGYAMGRFAGRSFDLGELGGVLKTTIYRRKIPLLLVPPTSLKLFATGKGNADKDQVKVAMSQDRGQLFTSDDEADAYALYRMGVAACDPRQRPRDRRHYRHAALRGCELVSASEG